MEFERNGGSILNRLIAETLEKGTDELTVSGNYEIEETILLPSDFTLTLKDAHLKMADGTFCNMFRNISCGTEKGKTLAGADHDITLRGEGKAILDGGEYNGLSERNSLKEGRPHISVNNILLFGNVERFRVEGLHVRNQRWWALNFVACREGKIRNVDFLSDFTTVDSDGVRHEGLGMRRYDGRASDYESVYIKNSDGIDLRRGCHDILIENVTGFTEDDTVALTALYGKVEELYGVPDADQDIYNVIIRNVMSSAYCANVRLLNQGGAKLYNILVDGVFDTSKGSRYMDRGGSGVRLGDVHLYGTRHASADETFNITIRNVVSRAGAAFRVAGAMKDCTFENIRGFDGCGKVIDDNASVDITPFIR